MGAGSMVHAFAVCLLGFLAKGSVQGASKDRPVCTATAAVRCRLARLCMAQMQ